MSTPDIRWLTCTHCEKQRKFELANAISKWWRCLKCGKTRRVL